MNTMLPPMNEEVARIRRQGMQRRYQRALRTVRWLWLVAAVLFVALVVQAIVVLLVSPRFWVYKISVSGVDTLTPAEVIRRAAVPPRTNYYRAPLQAVAARVAAEPRVADVQVERGTVGVLKITVTERQPVCRLGYAQPPIYLDADGVIFTRPVAPTKPVPVVQGIPMVDGNGRAFPTPAKALGQRLTGTRTADTLALLAVLRQAADTKQSPSLEVARIVHTESGVLVLVLQHGVRVFIGRPRDLHEKILVMQQTIVQANAKGYPLPMLDYVDVRGVEPGTVMNGVFKPRDDDANRKDESTP